MNLSQIWIDALEVVMRVVPDEVRKLTLAAGRMTNLGERNAQI
jgi:hypothetical protein